MNPPVSSNEPRPPSRDEIERQASRWAALLDSGPLTDTDRRALSAWLEAGPEQREVLARYREMSAQLSAQVQLLADPEEISYLEKAIARGNRWRRVGRSLLAAAAVVGLVAGVRQLLPDEVKTGSAERRALALADGSRVELNAGTELQVAVGGRERHVSLSRGRRCSAWRAIPRGRSLSPLRRARSG